METESWQGPVSELSARTGVSVPSIKYYLREGLLAAGTATAATRAVYDDGHVERLRLIRALREVADLPIAAIADVLSAVDDPSLPLHDVLCTAHDALGPRTAVADGVAAARGEVLDHLLAAGWQVTGGTPALDTLAGALVALRTLIDPGIGPKVFDRHLATAFELAGFELDSVDPAGGAADVVRQIVLGTVVFEQALVALRRLAQQHHSQRRFGPTSTAREAAQNRSDRSGWMGGTPEGSGDQGSCPT